METAVHRNEAVPFRRGIALCRRPHCCHLPQCGCAVSEETSSMATITRLHATTMWLHCLLGTLLFGGYRTVAIYCNAAAPFPRKSALQQLPRRRR